MAKPLKILVSGDVEGRLNQLYSRIKAIQKKAGSFDMLLCTGDFFGENDTEWQQYVSGTVKAPIQTYVLGPNKSHHTAQFGSTDGGDLCHNITYLGRRGMFSGSSGLQIAYLSGTDSGQEKGSDHQFGLDDLDALVHPVMADSKFRGVDILLTSQWSKGVEKYGSEVEGVDSKNCGSGVISQLALSLKPRYHFCALEGVFYERFPYRNHKVLAEGAKHVTRYIALAKVGNSQKKKYLYAFNIVPLKKMDPEDLTKQPSDVTECPYKLDTMIARPKAMQDEPASQYFYDMKSAGKTAGGHRKRHSDGGGGPHQKRPHTKPAQPTGPCWFCLGSAEVEKHLVASVGTHTYLAMAKGGMVPDHVLILPIGHHQSTVTSPPEVIEEIEQYKAAVKRCFKTHNKAAVFFERNYKTQHLQIQVVPIPLDLASEVKETFIGSALCQNIELHEIPKHSDLKQIVPAGAPYFYAELPSGEKLLYRIAKGFPLQFGREALADGSLLNMPDRIDWRNCKISKEEEVQLVQKFRDMFEKFDFTV